MKAPHLVPFPYLICVVLAGMKISSAAEYLPAIRLLLWVIHDTLFPLFCKITLYFPLSLYVLVMDDTKNI